MKCRSRSVAALTFVALSLGAASVSAVQSAHAEPGDCLDGEWVNGVLVCVIFADDTTGGQDGTQSPGGGSTTQSRYQWQLMPGGEINDAACGPDPAPDPNDPATPNMNSYVFRRTDLTTGLTEVVEICRSDSQPLATAPLPPVPTLTVVLDEADAPIPTVTVNPGVRGLTGLETWLWYDGPTELAVAVTLDGYTVTGTAGPVSFTWTMGAADASGVAVHTSAAPGFLAEPAARHTYETMGTYTITLTVTWSGSFTVTGNGLPGGPVDLGTTTVSGTLEYPVGEARSILVPSGG